MLEQIRRSGRAHTAGQIRITDGEDRHMFFTPDDNLRGLRITDFDEYGDVYKHPKYSEAVEQLEHSVRITP